MAIRLSDPLLPTLRPYGYLYTVECLEILLHMTNTTYRFATTLLKEDGTLENGLHQCEGHTPSK